jgi:hypothetical protein
MRDYKELINLPHLHYCVWVIVTNDICKAASKVKKADTSSEREFYEQSAALTLHNTHKGESFIIVTPKSDVGDVAHEVWHAVRKVFEWTGAELENEMVAYHIGYLMLYAWDVIKKAKKKKR